MQRPTVESCVQFLLELGRVNTTQPKGNESLLVDLIENIFKKYDIEKQRFDHGDNRSSLIIKIPGKENFGGIAFCGHLDTVSLGDESLWSHPPLGFEMEKGLVYGRGAADMKGGVASIIEMGRCILESDIDLEKPVYLCFTADEEVGGIGILSMLDSDWLQKVDEVVICEPSDEKIGIAEKGALWLKIEIKGKSSHGSRPEIGTNALENGILFSKKLREYVCTTEEHDLLGSNTMVITKINGGLMTNIIPDYAAMEMDIRTIPSTDHENIYKKAKAISRNMEKDEKNLSIKITILNNRPSVETNIDNPFVKRMQQVSKELGMDNECRGIIFYTDASQLIPKISVPFVILGPGDDKQAHQIDEHIDPKSIKLLADLYLNYVLKYIT